MNYLCSPMSEWKVKVNGGKDYQVNSGKEEILVDGQDLQLDLLDLENGKYHMIFNGRSYSASVLNLNSEEKKLTIKINNNTYDLEVEDQFDQLLHKLGMDNLAATTISQLKAPMPGLVLNVLVEVGQAVSKDDSLLILEAMKMENVLKAPADAVIKKIEVEEKQSVEKNQILIEFE